MGSYGISSGSHRLWAHKSYKANKKMQAMLLFFQTIAFQNCVIEWVRDHRVHHKFSDTNADPHNASRGFFFSHMGWLMCRKHPDVRKYGARVDMSDLESEPWLRFQRKYVVSEQPARYSEFNYLIFLQGTTWLWCRYAVSSFQSSYLHISSEIPPRQLTTQISSGIRSVSTSHG